MAIALTNSASNSTPATSPTLDPAAALHDVIIAAMVCDQAGATVTPLGGFDTLVDQATTTDGMKTGVVRKKDASGSEGTIAPITMNDTGIVGSLAFSGVDNTTSENLTTIVVNQNTGSASPLVVDSGSFTPTVDGCMIVAIMGVDNASSGDTTTTFSTISGTTGAWTKPIDITNGAFRNMAMAYALQTTAGAITVRASTTIGAGNMGGALAIIVLQPAGGGGGGSGAAVSNLIWLH